MSWRELTGALGRWLLLGALVGALVVLTRRPREPWEDCPCLSGAPPCAACERSFAAVERGGAPGWDDWCRACADAEGLWAHVERP